MGESQEILDLKTPFLIKKWPSEKSAPHRTNRVKAFCLKSITLNMHRGKMLKKRINNFLLNKKPTK